MGLLAGGAVGTALGIVPAFLTFGLSIPVGAAIGGGAGLCVGTTVCGTVGLLGGGAAGHKIYEHRRRIAEGARKRATGSTFMALLQDMWQYPCLSDTVILSMDDSTVQKFRALSRAGNECMRGVHGGVLLPRR